MAISLEYKIQLEALSECEISIKPQCHQNRSANKRDKLQEARILANGIFTDRNLNAMILNLVNENMPEIIRVGIPATRDQWAPVLVAHINEFFTNVPISKLLLL